MAGEVKLDIFGDPIDEVERETSVPPTTMVAVEPALDTPELPVVPEVKAKSQFEGELEESKGTKNVITQKDLKRAITSAKVEIIEKVVQSQMDSIDKSVKAAEKEVKEKIEQLCSDPKAREEGVPVKFIKKGEILESNNYDTITISVKPAYLGKMVSMTAENIGFPQIDALPGHKDALEFLKACKTAGVDINAYGVPEHIDNFINVFM